MKICPRCRRSYEDDTLVFCLDDGARLSGGPDQPDANATWHLPQTPLPTEVSPTIMPARPTVPAAQPTITARPDQFQYRHPIDEGSASSKPGPLPWILAIVLVVGISGVAIAYLLTRGDSTNVVTRNPTPDPRMTPAIPTPEPTLPRSSPEPTVDSPKKESTPKPTPKAEPTSDKPKFAVMNNISFNGTRITYYPRPSFGQCQADCAAMGNCKGFTWIRPGAYNPGDSAMCYLMSAVTDRVPHPCCISAVKN